MNKNISENKNKINLSSSFSSEVMLPPVRVDLSASPSVLQAMM